MTLERNVWTGNVFVRATLPVMESIVEVSIFFLKTRHPFVSCCRTGIVFIKKNLYRSQFFGGTQRLDLAFERSLINTCHNGDMIRLGSQLRIAFTSPFFLFGGLTVKFEGS